MSLIAEMVRQILILCFGVIWVKIAYDTERLRSMWRAGFVQPYEISKEAHSSAHSSRDEYLLELGKEAKTKEQENKEQCFRLLFLSISCLVLSGYNLFYDRASHATLLQHIERAIPQEGLLAMFLLIGVFLVMSVWLTLGNHDVYVYCPSIARKNVEEIEENEEALRKFKSLYGRPR